jgi:ABC-type lipopolysaccharide export system ATPase subunit
MAVHGSNKLTCRSNIDFTMSGLHVDSIQKNIEGRQLLSDIFISCKEGEVIGLLGRNGSGKSSLLKIIFGSMNADNSYVAIDGRRMNNMHDSASLIRYLPQNNFLPSHIYIKDIIFSFCSKSQAHKLFETDFVKPLLKKKSRQLSGGERRVVEVLIMIYSDAKYLLFDEPFNGIAPIYVETIKGLINGNSNGKGYIITDHDYLNILDISTRVVLLHEGGLKRISDSKELIRFGYLPDDSILA